jgi:hypothetical protein
MGKYIIGCIRPIMDGYSPLYKVATPSLSAMIFIVLKIFKGYLLL